MRRDALGLFWEDTSGGKRTPPDPTWEADDYLPHLKEALAFDVDLFTEQELYSAASAEELIYDIESYSNYWAIAFKGRTSGKVFYLQLTSEDECLSSHEAQKLRWIFDKCLTVGFNSRAYDNVLSAMAVAQCSCGQMNEASMMIIEYNMRPMEVLKEFEVKPLKGIDHIDIKEVAPLSASLKIYGGRLHSPRMQDLPFNPRRELTENQQKVTLFYCINDLNQTILLRNSLKPQLALRHEMGIEYRSDFRSRSDAQIAEDIITREMTKLTGRRPVRPEIEPGTKYGYVRPHFMEFKTPMMNTVLNGILATKFEVSDGGKVMLPDNIAALDILIGDTSYTIGIGGLHSKEESIRHLSDANHTLYEQDVTSYYPFIILLLGLYPKHLGAGFLKVYRRIVERRLAAKAAGEKIIAESLKIVINGSFGKFGSMWSNLYSPDLLIQTTITGQLSLLMLIEALELAGLPVVSANTDGVVIKCPKGAEATMASVVASWEDATGFNMEQGVYDAYYARDVNNYIAVKQGRSGTKLKGIFTEAGLSKNPVNWICIEAIQELLLKGTPVDTTIRACQDIEKFVTVRTVRGGGVKVGKDTTEYLGKAIRWYYAAGEAGEIVYAKSGNKVPRSDGAKPLMDLPDTFPGDIDYQWYITEAVSILENAGYPV